MKLQLLLYIVDDIKSDLELMAMWLRSETFDIRLFSDPKEFKQALNDDVSMVITDIAMTNYNVYDTVEQIRREYPGIYIIVVSGFLDKEIYERLMDCHVWNAIEKNATNWLEKLKLKVELTVPKMLNKKMALTDGIV